MLVPILLAFPSLHCSSGVHTLNHLHTWKCCTYSFTALQGINLAANAFLRWSLGPQYSAKLLAIMEMPKQETHLSLDFSSLLGPIFYCWLAQLLLPLLLVTLVYEKQRRYGFDLDLLLVYFPVIAYS